MAMWKRMTLKAADDFNKIGKFEIFLEVELSPKIK